MSDPSPSLVWFRSDLRLGDNPALTAAVARGAPILPIFVLDDETPGRWRPGGASRWWLHHSLEALAQNLARRGAPLILRRGDAHQQIRDVIAEGGAGAVFWNRRYEPSGITQDRAVKADLKAQGLEVESFGANLLHEPWTLRTKGGSPFRVFTPFWKAILERGDPESPLPAPERLAAGPKLRSDSLDDWSLLPKAPDWSAGLRAAWAPGEVSGQARLRTFLDQNLLGYAEQRNLPDRAQTSRLSPHLHWGEISPRQVWQWTRDFVRDRADSRTEADAMAFLRELGWREFSTHLLYHWPTLPERAWRPAFEAIAWSEDETAYEAWCRGRTGFPIVDAGMRELWTTGWMHNRVRMVAASFLIKDLLISWQQGEAWFWDTLVDADLANNAASWQWVAGSGADAAPYFRVFNPVLQGEKFDPEGHYVRRWLPELAALPDRFIHRPWEAPSALLAEAGVSLGTTYPHPLVDHGAARKRSLAAYEQIKKQVA